MTELMRRRRALMSGKKSRLPAGYQELLYVETNNTANSQAFVQLPTEWVSSGFSSDYTVFTTKTKLISSLSAENAFLGRTTGKDGSRLVEIYYKPDGTITSWGGWVLDLSVQYAKDTGNEFDLTMFRFTYEPFDFRLLSYRPDKYPFVGRAYGASAKTGNDVVFDCVPCRRTTDGEIGFYDLIGKTFCQNAGPGELIGGPIK